MDRTVAAKIIVLAKDGIEGLARRLLAGSIRGRPFEGLGRWLRDR